MFLEQKMSDILIKALHRIPRKKKRGKKYKKNAIKIVII